jgi:hypothetical protein
MRGKASKTRFPIFEKRGGARNLRAGRVKITRGQKVVRSGAVKRAVSRPKPVVEAGGAAKQGVFSSGNSLVPDGNGVFPIGKRTIPIGKPLFPDGTDTLPTGKTSVPNGNLSIPTGTSLKPFGKEAIPTGTSLVPDGNRTPR